MILRRAALAFVALCACGSDSTQTVDPPSVDCTTYLWARSENGAAPQIVGTATAGQRRAMQAAGGGWYTLAVGLPTGEYTYLVEEGGQTRLDAYQPLSQSVDDTEQSLLVVPDCTVPKLNVARATATADRVTIDGTFLSAGREKAPLARVQIDGFTTSIDPATGTFHATGPALARGRHRLVLSATDTRGRVASAATSVFAGARHTTWRDAVIYQIVTDRFRGPGGAPLSSPKSPGHRAGGTLSGVEASLASIEALGATAVWISPVYENPTGLFNGRDGHAYEGYHGYWPKSSRGVEPAWGGEAALTALVQNAHERGLSVIADLVPNHVHEQNPRYGVGERAASFHTVDACVCGEVGCSWGERILDCWFTSYLPDVRLEASGEMRRAADDASFWVETFDFDGVRLDAVPMMPRGSTRYLARALREQAGDRHQTLVMGEVFTGPGAGGVESIRYFLGPDTLDTAFDFPLMWAIRGALSGAAGFAEVDEVLALEATRWAGSGTIPARILGNHDTPRLVSELVGDAGADPWGSPATQPTDGDALIKAALGHALIFTLPGMPVVYQGDEVGLAGGGDPDNRRVMPSDAQLSPSQTALRDTVAWLARLRACSPALRGDERRALVRSERTYAFARGAGASQALVVLSTEATTSSVSLSLGGDWVDARSGDSFALPGVVGMPRLGFRVLLPKGDPCLGAR